MPVTKRKSADLDAPIWFDGTNINEALFCDEFLNSRKIIFANGAFFTPDGRVTDDLPLRGEIYEELTPTELQILHLLCADKSNAEIAQIMDVKLPTVKTHVSHILDKLDVKRRAEARTAAKKLHLVQDDL